MVAVLLMIWMSVSAFAQTTLSIVDALPPYDLTATLLNNGHFSLSTKYTDTSKTIIYREDGSGNRPVNYTSHIHFKVDDVVFQLPYEQNPVTRTSPPDNPLKITQLFRDTLVGRPRINARMFGVMPDGDTVRFLFTMEPVKRPSGGFIRLSATILGTGGKTRSVGVLMLIDTKIGANDQAPIITSLGYSTVETDFRKTVAPFMPEFWLATEGTPLAPGLTARGNLRASDLIEPDYFLFGNWVDYTAQGIRGLASVLWKERTASGLLYTDSAVLLLWEQMGISPGVVKLLASTEIGIVDSLGVGTGGSGGYAFGLAGGGIGGGGGVGCLSIDTLHEVPCGAPGYHPYSPDTLQTLYLVTNTGTRNAANVRLVVPNVPLGVSVISTTNPVIPGTMNVGVTGVASLSLYITPRLLPQSYSIPLALVVDVGDTILRDEIHVCVPGLLGEITILDAAFPPVCPNTPDTIDVALDLKGARCLDISSLQLLGTAPDINSFSIVQPQPTIVPADGRVNVRVRYQPTTAGPIQTVRLAATVRDFETLTPGDTTFAFLRDTATVTGFGKDAEFALARPTDTLDFGRICIGDTSVRDWDVRNVGGCQLTVDSVFRIEEITPGTFDVVQGSLPVMIARGGLSKLPIHFTPTVGGVQTALLIIDGDVLPFRDTLVLRGIGDIPSYTLAATDVAFDTLCPNVATTRTLRLDNPTACPVLIDTLEMPGTAFTVAPNRGFTIPPMSSVNVQVRAALTTSGPYTGTLTVRSAEAGDNSVPVSAIVAARALQTTPNIAFGDVRVKRTNRLPLTINSTGDAGVEISRIYVTGANSAEYTLILPPGTTFPLFLPPGGTLNAEVEFAPSDIEARRAAVVVETTTGQACETPEPVLVEGRGVLPIIDVPRRSFDFGRVCVGESIDTLITVRNVGNAGLTITGMTTTGAADMQVIDAPPVTIASNEQKTVRVRFTPTALGDIVSDLRIASDGDWFTAPDTLVRLSGAGILCGTLTVDTVRADVGTIADIPIRIIPRAGLNLQPVQIADLMNASGLRSFRITVGNNERNLRFQTALGTGGMIPTGNAGVQTAVTRTGITIFSDGTTGSLNQSNIFGVLRADVLLGDALRTDLPLTIEEFAGGFADLEVHQGLLVADYCAIDRRYVDVSRAEPFSRPAQQPLPADGVIEFYLPDAAHARLTLVDVAGRSMATLFDDVADGGLHAVRLPNVGIASGMHTVVLSVGGREYVTPVVIVR
jgi:hypothetical protein